jgi:hypothetical protein
MDVPSRKSVYVMTLSRQTSVCRYQQQKRRLKKAAPARLNQNGRRLPSHPIARCTWAVSHQQRRNMAGGRFNTFTCPNCQALYEIVKVEAGPETEKREIICRACGGSLTAREGEFVLK